MIPNFKREYIRFAPGTNEYRKFHEELYALQKGRCANPSCKKGDYYIAWSHVHYGAALEPHHEPPRSSGQWQDTIDTCMLLCRDCHNEIHSGRLQVTHAYGAVWSWTPITDENSRAARIKELREKEEQ